MFFIIKHFWSIFWSIFWVFQNEKPMVKKGETVGVFMCIIVKNMHQKPPLLTISQSLGGHFGRTFLKRKNPIFKKFVFVSATFL